MQLQLCFGISIRPLRNVEVESSDWHSKHLLLVWASLVLTQKPSKIKPKRKESKKLGGGVGMGK